MRRNAIKRLLYYCQFVFILYYLLAKLYAEPDFYHETKMKQMINIVLTKEPKVYSKAIHEMRMEMNILLNNRITN